MTSQALERTALNRLRRILPDDSPGPHPWLRSELFLIAHDDQTGRCHVTKDALAAGLAGAILFDLWLAGRVRIGWREDVRTGHYTHDPGLISVLSQAPTGDTMTDTALKMLWQAGGTIKVKDFVRQFAKTNLYERVRADMVAAGILHRADRRRFGLFRVEAYQPTEKAAVCARASVRDIPDRYRRSREYPEPRMIALAGLVTALRLTRRLYTDPSRVTRLDQWLRGLIAQQSDPTVGEVATAAAA
jgi:hypothetical protein